MAGGSTASGRRPGWRSASSYALGLIAALLLAAACGGSHPTPSPTPRPATPSPTPDVRLPDPTTADAVYTGLNAAGLGLVGTNAEAGTDPVKLINATYDGLPLVIVGYSSDAARSKLAKVTNGSAPAAGQPPYTFVAYNIVVEFGAPGADGPPPTPDATLASAAQTLAAALDRLIGPLAERSYQRVSPTPPATPSPVPSATVSPTPRVTPTPKPSPSR
jgi:hypothetical protein